MTKKKKTITPEEPKLFEKFWNEYAMKLDRVAAIKAWNNLDKDLRREAIDGIQHYCEICEALGVKRMWPQGYLNHRRWEDEADTDLAPNPAPTGVGSDTPPDNLPDMAIW